MNLKVVLPPVLVAVIGLGALSAVQDTGFREGIESDLTERAQAALSGVGLGGVDVEVTGRDADVTAPSDVDALAAAEVVSDVEGIRVARAHGPKGPASADSGLTEDSVSDSVSQDVSEDVSEETVVDEATDAASPEVAPPPEATGAPSDDGSAGGTSDTKDEERREPTREEREKAQEDLVEIPNITFVTDSARLTKDGRRVVRDAAEVLEEHPDVEVRIEGHTDSRGTEDHNLRLSERRADAVLDELARLGVDRDRLTATGFGEAEPLVVPRSSADLEKNRRVEFKVQP